MALLSEQELANVIRLGLRDSRLSDDSFRELRAKPALECGSG